MKRLLFAGILLGAATMGFAQGKVVFANDSLHLIYLTTDTTRLFPADIMLTGQAIPAAGVLPSGITLLADLWYGTSSSTLSLLTTTTVAGGLGMPGLWAGTTVTGLTAGATYFFQVRVYGNVNTYPPYYFGESPIFTCNASTSISPNSIVNHGGTAHSTWTDGTYPLDSVIPGAKGAIQVGATWGPPFIYNQPYPASQVVRAGDPATISVLVYNADYYQWRLNGTDIAGATSSIYALSSAQLTNAGTYNVAVSSVSYFFDPVISSNAVLQVLPPPTNWWTLQGTNLVLNWMAPWVLQDATNVLGPFHDVPGAASPYPTNVLLHPQLFFRWCQ